jgi:hypothetical protein
LVAQGNRQASLFAATAAITQRAQWRIVHASPDCPACAAGPRASAIFIDEFDADLRARLRATPPDPPLGRALMFRGGKSNPNSSGRVIVEKKNPGLLER